MSTVLLVDDEPGVLFTLSELVVEHGHRAVTAKSGAEALGKLDEADAVVTDLAMPGMTGLELIAQIAQRDSALPVILLTAHDTDETRNAARNAGATAYFRKPVDIEALLDAITWAASSAVSTISIQPDDP